MRSPGAPPDRRALEVRNLRDFETAWNRDFTRLDVERLASRYAADATLQLPNAPPAAGGEAIREAWKAAVQDGSFSMRMASSRIEVSRSGDLAYAQGAYTATQTDPDNGQKMRDTGTYVIVYRKTPGDPWKVVSDIRTRTAPPVEE